VLALACRKLQAAAWRPPSALAAVLACAAALAGAAPARAGVAYTVYAGNYGSEALTPIDAGANMTGTSIPVASPQAIAITPDGATAYVCDWKAGTVTPVTLATRQAGTPITVGANPSAIAITPDGSRAYVSNYNGNGAGTVSVITLATRATSTIAVGKGPYGVAITPDGAKAYVANQHDGTVTPITIATDSAGPAIEVGAAGVARTDSVVASPDGSTVYAANYGTDEVVPIAVASDTAGAPVTGVTNPTAIAITPDGSTAYIAEDGAPGHVRPLTLAKDSLGTPLAVGNNPYDLVVTPDQSSVYVANYNGDNASAVTPIDLRTGTAGAGIATGSGPDAIAVTPDQAPVASFAATGATAGSATSFDASSSTAAYGSITSYAWSFGDGASAITSSPTTAHTYATAGTYTVTLTETDSAGTSTTRVFTGRTMSRNGGPSARATRALEIVAPAPEDVSRSPSAPGAGAAGTHSVAPAIVISPRSVAVTARGEVQLQLSCPASALGGCRGRITLLLDEPSGRASGHAARCARGCRSLGSTTYEARAGQSERVRVRIAAVGRRLLAQRRRLRVMLLATQLSGSQSETIEVRLTLRAPDGRHEPRASTSAVRDAG
jgi:YVTN family beta-propeller protein